MKLTKNQINKLEEILIKMVSDIHNGNGGYIDDRVADIINVFKDVKVCSCKIKKDK